MPTTVIDPYRPLIVAAVLLVLVAIIGYTSTILIPIALGVLLSFVLTPPVAWMQARGIRRHYAVLLVVSLTLMVIVGMLVALTMQLRDLAGEVDQNKERIRDKITELTGPKGATEDGRVSRLWKLFEEISKDVRGQDDPQELKVQTVRILPEKGSAFSMVPVLAGPIWATLGKIGLTLGLTTSMLLMREDLRNRIFLLLGEGNLTSSTKAMDDASRRISRYLITQVALNASFGALFGFGLWVAGLFMRESGEDLPHYARYALVWGVLAAVLRFIPYVGTWMAAVFPVLVSVIEPGWVHPALVVGWCVVLGLVTNSLLEPMLVSRSTGVTPIALVVSAAFWTWLWGPIGLVLATPLTVCLSVLGKHVPSLRFLDVMLGSEAPLGPELLFYQRLLARDEAEASDLVDDYLKDHTTVEMLDQLIIPTLMRARGDHERRHLSDEELAALAKSVRDLLDDELAVPATPPNLAVALILACPAHDAIDQLVLEFFGRLLDPAKARLKILSADLTAAEVVEQASQLQPALACVGLLPPGGVSRARYLCKRMRARHPKLPIIAAVWGAGDPGELGTQLLAAGASEVAGSLASARASITPLVLVAAQFAEAAQPLEPVG